MVSDKIFWRLLQHEITSKIANRRQRVERCVGRFEAANRGTIFLDEVGDPKLAPLMKCYAKAQEVVTKHEQLDSMRTD